MRLFSHACLVAVMVTGLLCQPAFAANDKPLGMIIQSEGLAHLGAAKAAIGSTVYTGDTMFTESGATMRLRVGSSQLYLLSDSAASLAQGSSMVRVVVAHGTIGFSSPANDPIALDTPLGIVRPADGQAAFGQVTMNSPLEIVVTAYHGDLVVEENGNLHTIAEGKSYRISKELEGAEDPNASNQQSQGSGSSKKRRAGAPPIIEKVAIVAGVGVTSYFVWSSLCESPSRMKCLN